MTALSVPIGFVSLLSVDQRALLEEVFAAHQRSAANNQCISSVVAREAFRGSGNVQNAIIAGMLSLGGLHAPVHEARVVFENATEENIGQMVKAGLRVPGYGNSFFKNDIDPAWYGVRGMLREKFPNIDARIEEVGAWLWGATGKRLLPNASMFTAAACSVCAVPKGSELAVVIMARIPVWVMLCA